MEKIAEIQQCTDDIIRSRTHADEVVSKLRKWNKKELSKYDTDYLKGLDEALEELKRVLLKNSIEIRIWDGVKDLRRRIECEIERRNKDGENI